MDHKSPEAISKTKILRLTTVNVLMGRKAGWLYNKTSMDFSSGVHDVICTRKIQSKLTRRHLYND